MYHVNAWDLMFESDITLMHPQVTHFKLEERRESNPQKPFALSEQLEDAQSRDLSQGILGHRL